MGLEEISRKLQLPTYILEYNKIDFYMYSSETTQKYPLTLFDVFCHHGSLFFIMYLKKLLEYKANQTLTYLRALLLMALAFVLFL